MALASLGTLAPTLASSSGVGGGDLQSVRNAQVFAFTNAGEILKAINSGPSEWGGSSSTVGLYPSLFDDPIFGDTRPGGRGIGGMSPVLLIGAALALVLLMRRR